MSNSLPDPSTRGGLDGIECKHVVFIPADGYNRPDMHYVKEVYRYKDGSSYRNLRPIKEYKRMFWITQEHKRNHMQKKEVELFKNLVMYKSTQSDLGKNVATRLGSRYNGCKHLRDVVDSPYFYGGSTTAADEIKYKYYAKFPNLTPSNNTMASLDIEADIDTGEIPVISVARENEIYTTILKSILPHTTNIEAILEKMARSSIPDPELAKSVKLTYVVCDNEVDVIKLAIQQAHIWQPDFLAIWNIGYDIPQIMKRLEFHGEDPKDIFSDPRIHPDYRYFRWRQGSVKKVTDSGKVEARAPHTQWHNVITPASFFLIDAMSAYNFVRAGQKNNPLGYSLDAILTTHLGSKFKKLKFQDDVSDKLVGEDWHKYMLSEKPLEYIIYNQWDTLAMITLDNEIKDLQVKLPALSGLADYGIFNSGPRKLITKYTWYCYENGYALSTRPSMIEESNVLDRSNWIITLNIDYTDDVGLKNILGAEELVTNIRTSVFDSDAVSSYPSNIEAANVSKDTTSREIVSVAGMDVEEMKHENINCMFGPINHVQYMTTVCNFPTLEELYYKIK